MIEIPLPTDEYIKIEIEVINHHNHSAKPQLRGKLRTELAKDIILNHGGSSANARDAAKHYNENINNVHSACVYSKCKSQYNNKDTTTNDWYLFF